jgi:adenosylcobinamide-phosphate synthase
VTDAVSHTPLIVVLVALVADGILSGLPGLRWLLDLPHAMIRNLARWFDTKLNRVRRGRGALRLRGTIVAIVVVAITGAAGYGLEMVARQVSYGGFVYVGALLFLLGLRRPVDAQRRTLAALQAGDDSRSAGRVASLVRFDVPEDDPHAIARAAVEGGTARIVEGLFATVLWFLLLGLPGLCVYRGLGVAADAIGRSSPRHADFGFVVARLNDVLSLPGALLAGPVLSVAALFCPGASFSGAVAGWLSDLAARGVAPGYRAEGAVAGAFGLAFGGPRLLDGETITGSWIGDGRARVGITDVRRSVFLLVIAALLVGLAVALALGSLAR